MRTRRDSPSTASPLLSERVYETLLRRIEVGELKPGERVKDDELANAMGVSRTPVREAMNRLQDEGLLETAAGRWTRVTEISPDEVRHLFPIREVLEVLALSLAFPFLGPEDVAALEDQNRRIDEALLEGDIAAASAADRALHDHFIDKCGNPDLIRLIRRLEPRIRRLYWFYFSEPKGVPRFAVQEHSVIIAAIGAHNQDEACECLKRHMSNLCERMRGAAGIP